MHRESQPYKWEKTHPVRSRTFSDDDRPPRRRLDSGYDLSGCQKESQLGNNGEEQRSETFGKALSILWGRRKAKASDGVQGARRAMALTPTSCQTRR